MRTMTGSDVYIITALLQSSRHKKKGTSNFMENLNVHWHHVRVPPDHTFKKKVLGTICGSTTTYNTQTRLLLYCGGWLLLVIAFFVNGICGPQCRTVQSVRSNMKMHIFSLIMRVSTLRNLFHQDCEVIILYGFATMPLFGRLSSVEYSSLHSVTGLLLSTFIKFSTMLVWRYSRGIIRETSRIGLNYLRSFSFVCWELVKIRILACRTIRQDQHNWLGFLGTCRWSNLLLGLPNAPSGWNFNSFFELILASSIDLSQAAINYILQ